MRDTGAFKANAKKAEITRSIIASLACQMAKPSRIKPITTSQKRTNVFVSISIRTFISYIITLVEHTTKQGREDYFFLVSTNGETFNSKITAKSTANPHIIDGIPSIVFGLIILTKVVGTTNTK